MRIKFEATLSGYQYYFFGWLIYYLMGLQFKEEKIISRKNYMAVLISFFINISVNIILYLHKNDLYSYVTSQLNIFNMFCVISIIPFIINNICQNKLISTTLEKIGDYSFGIYFIHMIMLRIINYGFKFLNMWFIAEYFLKVVLVLFSSYCFMYCVKKITKNKIDKYIAF